MSASDLTALHRAYALVCPQICTNSSSTGPAGPPGPAGPQGDTGPAGPATDLTTNPVGSYYSDQTQNISDTATTIWTINQTVFQRSISIVSGTQITVAVAGVYEIYYSAQIHRTAGGQPVYIYIWLKKNNNDEPETNGRVAVNSNNGDTLPIVPYIIQLNAGDYLEFASRATDINCQILATDSATVPFGPAIPSLIVGIKRIG